MTLLSCLLMTDWQALPYDKCTEYSPFHHPEIFQNSPTLTANFSSVSGFPTKRRACYSHEDPFSGVLIQLNINPTSQLVFSTGQKVSIHLQDNIKLSCHTSEECRTYCREPNRTIKPLCLQYSVNKDGCLELQDGISNKITDKTNDGKEAFFCSTNFGFQSQFSICIQLHKNMNGEKHEPVNKPFKNSVHAQTLQHLNPEDYNTAMFNCINANVTSHDCYWNPYSIITRRHCEDCQPICRSRSHSLTFAQFVLGAALLLASIPVAWVPVAALISNRVSKEAQVTIKPFWYSPLLSSFHTKRVVVYTLFCIHV